MKYGIVFAIVAVLLAASAVMNGGWQYVLIWPALSFALVALAYLRLGPRVFGKSEIGVLSPINVLLLLPYFLYVWSVWHIVRLFSREPPFDQLTENIFLGRRLLSHELPADVDHVIDLTCEFAEPKALRSTCYHSFQILDGMAASPEQLREWAAQAAGFSGRIYIHCAKGQGRSGLFAVALLLELGHAKSTADAIQLIQSKRPQVYLEHPQRMLLQAMYS